MALIAGAACTSAACYAATPAGDLASSGFSATLVIVVLGIVALAHVCGWLARRMGQPALLGQVGAGLLLGPALSNPAPGQWVWSEPLSTTLMAIAQVGIGIHLLRAGLQFSRQALRTATIPSATHLLRIATFTLGATLAMWFYRNISNDWRLVPFALILAGGFALCIPCWLKPTPADSGRTPSAHNNASLIVWLLPPVVALLAASPLPTPATLTYVIAAGIAALLAHRWLACQARRDLGPRLAIPLALLILIAIAALELLGLPAALGVLGAGLLLSAATRPARQLNDQLLPLQTLLLPAFFLATGLRIDLSAPPFTTWLAAGIAAALLTVASLTAHRLAQRHFHRVNAPLPPADWTVPAALALLTLQLGFDQGPLPPPLYSALALGLLAAIAMTTLVAKHLEPRSAETRPCVLLHRIAP